MEEMHYEKINNESKINAIWSSGFLLERRVASFLRKLGYKTVANRGFYDRENNKSREYDVYAYKDIALYEGNLCSIFPTLVCECKNNSQSIAFFIQDEGEFEPLIDEIRVSGIPSKIWQRNKYISIQDFIGLAKVHHYCVPKAPVATQCCTFEKISKGKVPYYKATHSTHDQDLYDTYRTLTKALENEIDDDFKNMNQWFNPEDIGKEFTDLSFYYPLVIYQGDIDAVYVGNNNTQNKDNLVIKSCDHIQYNPEFYSFNENEVISYHIDIITEKYLPSYIKLIESEMAFIEEVLQQKKTGVLRSVDKIIGECQSLEKRPNTLRKQLEYQL
jgi:hypothetical protein